MKKCSTQSNTSDTPASLSASTTVDEMARPGKLALEIIRRFARSYRYEPRLASLGSLSVN
ncbi:MAG: hypothetical protein HDR83_06610 [Bacteroides sp.]|nr:hypothetical protein [Barnesiella sp.]MBD5253420.1 hypothetical protein [Barnesiella sp.]MBD5344482.1 hypothetical protein [Bacteroides sp.]MBD5368914.1 hypothetical protein [Bacteroides sp.]MDE5829866.1 hypothetical protein [Duncaniella sp.]